MSAFPASTLERGVYSIEEAGRRLGMSSSTAYEHVKAGTFPVPVVRIGGRKRVLVHVLEAFLRGEPGQAAS